MNRRVLHFIIEVYLSFIASLYFILSLIFGLPETTNVLGAIVLLILFLGLRMASGPKEFIGQIVIDKTEEGKTIYSLDLEGDPMELEDRDFVTFKVGPRFP